MNKGTRQCVLCAVRLAPRLDARSVCEHTRTGSDASSVCVDV